MTAAAPRLLNRVALITGAARMRGVGRAVALRGADEGSAVCPGSVDTHMMDGTFARMD